MGVQPEGWGVRGRYLALGVTFGLLASAFLAGTRLPRAEAQAGTTQTAGTIAFTAPSAGGNPLLFLIDTNEKAFAIYRVDPAKGSVKLESSRPYRYDLKLEWNNLPPEASAVEAMIATTGRK